MPPIRCDHHRNLVCTPKGNDYYKLFINPLLGAYSFHAFAKNFSTGETRLRIDES
jgi:hypothetical protein